MARLPSPTSRSPCSPASSASAGMIGGSANPPSQFSSPPATYPAVTAASPSLFPALRVAVTSAPPNPLSYPSTLSSVHRPQLASLPPSARDNANPQRMSSHASQDHTTFVSNSGTTGAQRSPNRTVDLRNVSVELSSTAESNQPDWGHGLSIPSVDAASSSGEQSGRPEHAQGAAIDDLIRTIKIIKPGVNESTHLAEMLIDSGNHHENLISRSLVQELGLTPSNRRKSRILRRCWHKLAPWTKSARAARMQAKKNMVRGFDGRVLLGQDGSTVTISWYARNPAHLDDPMVFFRPVRYATTHTIVDADRCAAEVVLRWREVGRLQLRQRPIASLPRPPTPDLDPEKYAEYLRSRAARDVARAQARGNGHGRPPGGPDGRDNAGR